MKLLARIEEIAGKKSLPVTDGYRTAYAFPVENENEAYALLGTLKDWLGIHADRVRFLIDELWDNDLAVIVKKRKKRKWKL